jgi:hypothetical protein
MSGGTAKKREGAQWRKEIRLDGALRMPPKDSATKD